MATYTVKLHLNHDGKAYEPGQEVELDEKAATVLIQDGVVENPNAGEEEAKPEEATEDAQPDLEGMTAAELKEEAAKRDLSTSGTKAELIERIKAADAESEEDDEDSDL